MTRGGGALSACNPRGKSGKEQRLEGSFIGGHLASEGNLQQLLKLQAENDPDMMQWLQHSMKFTSHKCVEEVKILFSHKIQCSQYQGTIQIIFGSCRWHARRKRMSKNP